jgi:hypothetical protein
MSIMMSDIIGSLLFGASGWLMWCRLARDKDTTPGPIRPDVQQQWGQEGTTCGGERLISWGQGKVYWEGFQAPASWVVGKTKTCTMNM